MEFRCSTTGSDSLGLKDLLERFANDQWIGNHYTPEQAVSFVVDRFKRRIAADLEMIELTAPAKRLELTMPTFEIEQYEVHVQRHQVQANSEAEAIKRLFDGQAVAVDNSLELVEVCDELGLPLDEYPDLAKQLQSLGVTLHDDVIPSIRSVEEVS